MFVTVDHSGIPTCSGKKLLSINTTSLLTQPREWFVCSLVYLQAASNLTGVTNRTVPIWELHELTGSVQGLCAHIYVASESLACLRLNLSEKQQYRFCSRSETTSLKITLTFVTQLITSPALEYNLTQQYVVCFIHVSRWGWYVLKWSNVLVCSIYLFF